MKTTMADAGDWIGTDRRAVQQDIARLGVAGAADYQMDLIADRTVSWDSRWDGITTEAMEAALAAM